MTAHRVRIRGLRIHHDWYWPGVVRGVWPAPGRRPGVGGSCGVGCGALREQEDGTMSDLAIIAVAGLGALTLWVLIFWALTQ